MKLATLKKPVNQPKELTLVIEREATEEFLDNVTEKTKCLDAIATILNFLDPANLRQESQALLGESKTSVPDGLSSILAACSSEIQIEVSNFRRDYCQSAWDSKLFRVMARRAQAK
jgi:hypothetical protein